MDTRSTWLHRYCVLLAVATLFLVVAGASVTSNDAGLSVPDWPLSYGKVMPPMTGGIFYEHGHRLVASTVGLLTIVLAVWMSMSESRKWMRRLGFVALAAVVAQGILGGMTVIFMLPKAVSIAHACLAELFFSLTVALAIFTSNSWIQGPRPCEDNGWPSLRSLAILLPVTALAQVALGASYRHRLLGIVPHVLGAVVVMAFAMMVAVFVLMQYRSHVPMARTAKILLGLVTCQVFLGIAAYMSRISAMESGQRTAAMIGFTVAHVAVGASVMATSVALALWVVRDVRKPDESGAACLPPVGRAA